MLIVKFCALPAVRVWASWCLGCRPVVRPAEDPAEDYRGRSRMLRLEGRIVRFIEPLWAAIVRDASIGARQEAPCRPSSWIRHFVKRGRIVKRDRSGVEGHVPGYGLRGGIWAGDRADGGGHVRLCDHFEGQPGSGGLCRPLGVSRWLLDPGNTTRRKDRRLVSLLACTTGDPKIGATARNRIRESRSLSMCHTLRRPAGDGGSRLPVLIALDTAGTDYR